MRENGLVFRVYSGLRYTYIIQLKVEIVQTIFEVPMYNTTYAVR